MVNPYKGYSELVFYLDESADLTPSNGYSGFSIWTFLNPSYEAMRRCAPNKI